MNRTYESLFSDNTLKLGQIHWYLLKADNEMEARSYTAKDTKDFGQPELTDFGKEVGRDRIHWWVFKREDNIDELRRRTELALTVAQELKQASSALKASFPRSYDKLLSILREFTEAHASAIDVLHDYVRWLHERNNLAPSILFAYRVWGSTRLSERWVRIDADTIQQENPQTIRRLSEIVLGLFRGGAVPSYTVDAVRREVEYELYSDIDPEDIAYGTTISIPSGRVVLQTCYETISECATYFELIRNSLRNILVDIEKHLEQRNLMRSDAFWKRFIEKALSVRKTETQLWDFKQSLDMWWLKQGEKKDEAKVEFAEDVASLANANGGVLILGVSDTPRKVVGIGDTLADAERRLDFTRKVISSHIEYDRDIVYFHQVALEDESGEEKICLVIAVAQANAIVPVKDKKGRYTYPVRRETGIERASRDDLWREKLHIKSDNYDFIHHINQFIYNA